MSRLWKSFTYAAAGIAQLVREELSIRLMALAGFIVLVFIIVYPLRKWEAIILLLLVFSVWVLEVLNSILERMTDMVKPRLHEGVKTVKDMMAGVVLLSSVGSLIVGLVILVPYFIAGVFRW